MRRKSWIIAAVVLLVLGASAGWYFASPAWTLKQMADAAEARDAEKLSAHIDYSKLRESTKSQMRAAMGAKLADGSANGFEALGLAIGMGFVDRMVDGLVTPEGMAAMFANAKRQGQAAPSGPAGRAARKPMGLDASNREIIREGFNRFRLHEKGKPGQDGDLIFERDGLGWKLVAIDMPKDLFADGKQQAG